MNLKMKSVFLRVSMRLALPMTASADEGGHHCRHGHRHHGHHGPPVAEVAFRWHLGGGEVAFRPVRVYRPEPRRAYRPNGRDAYRPQGNDAYVPRGDDAYVPRGDDAYVPRGNEAYRPRGRGGRR